jgi:hypothetical protein
MPQLARCHFEREALGLGELADVGALDYERQAKRPRGLPDQALIGVAGGTTKPVVEVGDGQTPAIQRREVVQQVKEDQGIDAAGNCYQHRLTRSQQTPVPDTLFDLIL